MVESSSFPNPGEGPEATPTTTPEGVVSSEAGAAPEEAAPGSGPAVSADGPGPGEPAAGEEPPGLDEPPSPEPPAQAAPAPAEPAWPAPAPPEPESGLVASLEAPAIAAEPGGEWDLLVAKVREWIGSGEPQKTFRRYSSPLQAAGLLLGVVLLLRLYAALLGAIEGLPLVPGLLELVGVIWLTRFSLTNLVRSSERQRLFQELQQRWSSFRGKSSS